MENARQDILDLLMELVGIPVSPVHPPRQRRADSFTPGSENFPTSVTIPGTFSFFPSREIPLAGRWSWPLWRQSRPSRVR
jgi:hypothetical protein